MNKAECKKFLRKAYKSAIAHNKSITPQNIEDEMKKVIEDEGKIYIAYAKIATYNMNTTANEIITLNDLMEEINFLPKIYTKFSAVKRARNL